MLKYRSFHKWFIQHTLFYYSKFLLHVSNHYAILSYQSIMNSSTFFSNNEFLFFLKKFIEFVLWLLKNDEFRLWLSNIIVTFHKYTTGS